MPQLIPFAPFSNRQSRRPRVRPTTETRRARAVTPALEALEERQLLSASNGGQWAYTNRITYSFVPDGTSVGGLPSTLFSTLNSVSATATWEAAFQKAAAIWSSYANVNIAQVNDDGSAIGVQGNQQDDPRFGDIRIAMVSQSNSVLAYGLLPPPFNGGTVAGDIVFNSNIAWQVNNDYDIETVAIHEMGHVLGLDHSKITSAVMYAYYNGQKQSLTSDDITGIQSVLGAYPSDKDTNRSFAAATNITPLINSNNQIAISGLNVAGASDYDYFAVTVPAGTKGTMTVSMQATSLSSVSPRLAIYNSGTALVAQNSMANSYGSTATITLSGVTAGQVYYVRSSAASVLGSFGSYGLLVNFGSSPQGPIAPPNTAVAAQPDQGTAVSSNDTTSGGSGGGLLGGLIGGVLDLVGDILHVKIGTLSAWGEPLEAKDMPHHAIHPVHHYAIADHAAFPGHTTHEVFVNVGETHHFGSHRATTHAHDQALASWGEHSHSFVTRNPHSSRHGH